MTDTRALAVVVVAVLPACLDSHPPAGSADIGKTSHAVEVPATWDTGHMANVTFTLATQLLKKTSGVGTQWDAGAASVESIGRQGYVSFSTAENNKAKALGLSQLENPGGDDAYDLADIDYAIVLGSGGNADIVEDGSTVVNNAASYAANDIFSIETVAATDTEGQKIKYWKGLPNGAGATLLRTTNITQTQLRNDIFPLQVDTSFRNLNATITNVQIHPTIHVGWQNRFFPSPRCAVGDVMVVSGHYFYQIGTHGIDTVEEFGDPQVADRTTIWNHLDANASDFGFTNLDDVRGIVMIDIEGDSKLRDLWNHTPTEKAQLIDGFIERIAGAKLAFPNAKLALYGTLNPQGQGNPGDPPPAPPSDYQQRRDALIAAGEAGMYEDIDYLVPVVYTIFGCDDVTGEPVTEPCDPPFDKLDEYTRLGLEGSWTLKKMDDSDIPLLPVVSVRVLQKDVPDPDTLFPDVLLRDLGVAENDPMHPGNPANPFAMTLNLQMKQLLSPPSPVPPVRDVVLWIGGGTPAQTLPDEDEQPSSWTVDYYTCRM